MTENLSVAPAPTLGITALGSGGDAGRPLLLNVSVHGGVPPYSLAYSLLPSGSSGTVPVGADGAEDLAIVPDTPGPVLLQAELTDAAGGTAGGTFALGSVGVGPSASIAVPETPVEAGQPLAVGLAIVGGAGPFEWSIEPSAGIADDPEASGVASAGIAVNWSGVPTVPGPLVLTAFVVDAVGGFTEVNRTIPVLLALSLSAVLSNASEEGASSITVYADVGGGSPPYALEARIGDLSTGLANLTTAGGYTLRIPDAPDGFDAVHVDLSDSAGFTANRTPSTFVAPGTPGAAPTVPPVAPTSTGISAGAAGVGAALLLGGIAGGYWWWRRRTRGTPPPGGTTESGRALGFVRRSLTGGDGLDPESLGLLAEEEGIPPASVEAALRQWERLGRIRRETDESGGELVHWNAPGTFGPTEPEAP
jgi:hypothetical protein